jgi:hypothetical protein
MYESNLKRRGTATLPAGLWVDDRPPLEVGPRVSIVLFFLLLLAGQTVERRGAYTLRGRVGTPAAPSGGVCCFALPICRAIAASCATAGVTLLAGLGELE